MAVVQMEANLLKEMLRSVVTEVVQKEMLKLRLSLLPTVSDQEMEDINRQLGKPEMYESQEYESLSL